MSATDCVWAARVAALRSCSSPLLADRGGRQARTAPGSLDVSLATARRNRMNSGREPNGAPMTGAIGYHMRPRRHLGTGSASDPDDPPSPSSLKASWKSSDWCSTEVMLRAIVPIAPPVRNPVHACQDGAQLMGSVRHCIGCARVAIQFRQNAFCTDSPLGANRRHVRCGRAPSPDPR
jgi:hypothetical protein